MSHQFYSLPVIDGQRTRISRAKPSLTARRAHPLARQAAMIGEVRAEPQDMVYLKTEFGGTRVLDMLVGDPLPRIC